jgi:Icc-related predicted phosphoesterase
MRLILISDTHNQHKALTIPGCDILIHAGDFTSRGEENRTIEFLEWFEAQKQCKNRVYVAGNHDFMCERDPAKFLNLHEKYAPTCVYLEDQSIVVEGYKIHGSPISPWFMDWAFNRHRGADIQKHWDLIPGDTEILVTHGPVLGYGDKLSQYGSEPGKNIGCADLLKTIDSRLKILRLVVTAHIHEGSGVYAHGDIIVVNASVLDERYRMKNPPRMIDLPDKKIV